MAPTANPICNPCAAAIPTRAIPMVPAVVQELPMASDTNAQMTQAAA